MNNLAEPTQSQTAQGGEGGARSVHFQLANGMEAVVVPDRRAPVVTHMVWYRNGSADDPPGKSGIAHFLEHLMFKGTRDHKQGEFSEVIAELGGQENAFTSNDYTAYFQRVPKEHLGVVMAYEADRMRNLVLTDDVVAPERDVVLEERRMRTDSDPGAQLNEAVQAALFPHHPYGTPIIGWEHEIETLGREDAIDYYRRFYTPENSVLVIAGDVDPQEARVLAEKHYGPIAPMGAPPVRKRRREPPPRAHRQVSLADEKVEQASLQRVYLAPSYATAEPGVAEALEVAAHLLGGGQTSRLYRELVLEQKIAVGAGAYYLGTALDDTRFWVYAVPAPGIDLEALDKAVVKVIEGLGREDLPPDELLRAKTRLVADAVYAQDSQATLARWYGASLTTGGTIEDVREWPSRIDRVSASDVQSVISTWLTEPRSVTGFLLPAKAENETEAA